MTRVPTLYPGEQILTVSSDVAENRIEIEVAGWDPIEINAALHEGAPWAGDDSFAALQRHMTRQLGEAFGMKPIHQGRKTCLSCGAIQTLTGDLPCGH